MVDIAYLFNHVMEATIAADIALTWQLSVPVSEFAEAVGPCDTPEAENILAIARLMAALLDGDSRIVASPSVQDAQEEFLEFFETVVDSLRGRLDDGLVVSIRPMHQECARQLEHTCRRPRLIGQPDRVPSTDTIDGTPTRW